MLSLVCLSSCITNQKLGNSGCSISINAANPGVTAQACIQCDSLQRLQTFVINKLGANLKKAAKKQIKPTSMLEVLPFSFPQLGSGNNKLTFRGSVGVKIPLVWFMPKSQFHS